MKDFEQVLPQYEDFMIDKSGSNQYKRIKNSNQARSIPRFSLDSSLAFSEAISSIRIDCYATLLLIISIILLVR